MEAQFPRPENGNVESLQPSIPLQPMIQQMEVRTQHDDWTGITDPAERRRLQNRLHQRLWRKKHGSKATKKGPEIRSAPKKRPGLEEQSEIKSAVESSPVCTAIMAKQPTSMCNMDPINTQKVVEQFENWYQSQMTRSPSTDNLLSLVQFNVFRAMMSNTFALGFGTEWLDESAISSFNKMPQDGLQPSYPVHLQPTPLQHAVEHHPWIDLFPIPRMRDNLLAADGAYDEDELCADLVEFCKFPGKIGGLLVWGDPSNLYSWEVDESLVKKWGWILKGCHELLKSTNYWRVKRGEKKLIFEI